MIYAHDAKLNTIYKLGPENDAKRVKIIVNRDEQGELLPSALAEVEGSGQIQISQSSELEELPPEEAGKMFKTKKEISLEKLQEYKKKKAQEKLQQQD